MTPTVARAILNASVHSATQHQHAPRRSLSHSASACTQALTQPLSISMHPGAHSATQHQHAPRRPLSHYSASACTQALTQPLSISMHPGVHSATQHQHAPRRSLSHSASACTQAPTALEAAPRPPRPPRLSHQIVATPDKCTGGLSHWSYRLGLNPAT
jgi:hypothetical protein